MMGAVIVVGFVLGAWLFSSRNQGNRLGRLGRARERQPRWVGRALLVVGIISALGLVLIFAPSYVAWVAIAGVLGLTLAWELRMHRAEKTAIRRSTQVAHACRVIAAQLRIGQTPGAALSVAAQECDLLEECLTAQLIGGDVPQSLMHLGERPGCSGMSALGRAWRLCERSGSPLAPAAARVSQTVDADTRLRADIAAELAVPRATGRLLTALPALGIAMGFMSGGNPIAFLTTTMVGKVCLAGAVVLAYAGLVWTELLASRAQEHR